VDDAPDCLVIGDIDHDAIFPKVAAVVHHGGAGTTAAAARAGVPQVIAPMFNDQFYWAMRIEALGLGASFPHASMTEAALAGALRAALSPDARDRAHAFAARMGREGARIAAERLAAEFGSSES
jgi:vancomycin aglycone glucosyltransferase